MSPPARPPLSPVVWALFAGTLVNRAASFVGVFLALHLTRDLGLPQATAGWIVGCWGLGSWLASPVAGVLTDRAGRRTTMLLGLALGGLTVLGLAFATELRLVFALTLLGGATQQLYYPASSAAIADVVPPEERDRAFGLIYWAMNLGLTVGFAVGGLVPEAYLRWLFVADGATSLLTAALVAWRVPETRPPEAHHDPVLPGLVRVARDGPFMAFTGLHLAALVVFTQFQLALPLDMRAHGQSSRAFSWLMAWNCAGVVALQPWLQPRLRRFDRSRLLAVAALLFGAGYALNAAVPWLAARLAGAGGLGAEGHALALYLLGATFWTVGEVIAWPVSSALVADLSPVALRGRYQGAYAMVWGLGMGLSPIVGGEVLERLGAPVLWLGCLALGALVALGQLAAAPARRRRLAAAAARGEGG